MTFTRTSVGLTEKWRFYQVPTIWVEGPTDIFFYEPLTDKISCRIEAFHGSKDAEVLVQALIDHDYPYLVILDGDYRILERKRVQHRFVIVLPRYSFENFLWEHDPANRACLRHARCGDDKDLVTTEMRKIEAHLRRELSLVLALDIAARRTPSPPRVLPDAIERLALNQSGPDVDPVKVANLVSTIVQQIDPDVIQAAEADLDSFLERRSIRVVPVVFAISFRFNAN
jgi:hypothetical protein